MNTKTKPDSAAPGGDDFARHARRIAGYTGVFYNAEQKCELGAPFYAFTPTEVVMFANRIDDLAALSAPKSDGDVERRALLEWIDRYWELAYAEGKEGRNHDTENGDAQVCRYEIEKRIAALSAPKQVGVESVCVDVEQLRYMADEMRNFADVADDCQLTEGNAPVAIRSWCRRISDIIERKTVVPTYVRGEHISAYKNAFQKCANDPDDNASPEYRGIEAVFSMLDSPQPAPQPVEAEGREAVIAPFDRDKIFRDAEFRAAAYNLMQLVEGPGCKRWEDGNGFRLKDTNEWCWFYVAVKNVQNFAEAPPEQPAIDACAPEIAGYAVFGKSDEYPRAIRIPGYGGGSIGEVKEYVLTKARREGFKGTADERLAELGWWIEPVYRVPKEAKQQPAIELPSETVNALPENVRRYIMWLQTDADPAGTIRQNWMLTQENKALRALIAENQAIDLEVFRPAVEALEREGRKSEVKDGVLHWTLNAKHYRAQELFAIIDGAKAGRAEGEES